MHALSRGVRDGVLELRWTSRQTQRLVLLKTRPARVRLSPLLPRLVLRKLMELRIPQPSRLPRFQQLQEQPAQQQPVGPRPLLPQASRVLARVFAQLGGGVLRLARPPRAASLRLPLTGEQRSPRDGLTQPMRAPWQLRGRSAALTQWPVSKVE